MLKWLSVLVVGFVGTGLAPAQDELIKDFAPAHFEDFLKNDLRRDFVYQDDRYDIKDTPYYGVVQSKYKTLFIYTTASAAGFVRPVTLETLNSWNKAAFATRAYFIDQDTFRVEGSLDYAAGITRNQLRSFYGKVDGEWARLMRDVVGPAKGTSQPAAQPPTQVAQPRERPTNQVGGRGGVDVIRQDFPANAAALERTTGWEIEWDFAPSPHKSVHLLRIVSARFNFKDNGGVWRSVVVARHLELAEAFAPYDNKTTSFLDLALANRADRTVLATDKLKGPACVAAAEIVKWSQNPALTIFREVHDDGVRWLKGYGKKGIGENAGYRGEKLALCSIFQAVNYLYLMEYNFTDDGRIVCRLGFTGHNYFNRGKNGKNVPDNDGDVHLHVGCWRMEFDLGDPANNEYLLVRRYFDSSLNRFRVGASPFNDGREGKARWHADEFTALRVVSGSQASLGGKRRIAYDLIPSRLGSARDVPATADVKNTDMDFVNYDFWLTHRTDPRQPVPFHKVPALASGQKTLKGQPVTVWYSTPAIHVPRGEDFGSDGQAKSGGVALTTWVEFTLRPRDLFDSTPLYP